MADPVTIFTNIAIAAATSAISNALAPKQKFEGPRLDDLRVQTSTYGKFRPIPFGTIAYAGNVFWLENNELKETKHKESSGKGGPKTETTTYTYSATFAVGLGEGEIDGVTRIWADNKLIYDVRPSAGTETLIESGELFTALTVYLGSETQEVNARMEAEDSETPAYRGEAYVVIEDFQLEKFGNRIPNFTFEAVANATTATPTVIETFDDPGFNSIDWMCWKNESGVLTWMKRWSNSANPATYETKRTTISGQPIMAPLTKTITVPAYASVSCAVENSPGNGYFFLDDQAGSPFELYLYNANTSTLARCFHNDGSEIGTLISTIPTVRQAVLYDGTIYAILGDQDGSSSDGPRIWGFSVGGGVAQYYTTTTRTIAAIFVNSDGVYVQENSGGGTPLLRLFDHTLTTELNSWDIGGISSSRKNRIYVEGDRIVRVYSSVSTWHGVQVYQINTDGTSSLLGQDTQVSTNDHQAVEIGYKMLLVNGVAVSWDEILTDSSTTLSSLVSSLCVKSGLETSDIDVAALTDGVDGYAVTSLGSLKSAIEPLQIAYQFDALESEYKLKFVKRGGSSVVTLSEEDLAAHEFGQDRGDELPAVRGKESELPRETKLTYISSARDYESDTQSASRLVTESEQVNEINLPIVLSDDKAAQIAEIAQTVAWIERNTYPEFSLPYKYSYLEPSDVITVNLRGITHKVRITQTDLGNPGILKCSGVAEKTAHYTSIATGIAGQASSQTLGLSGPTNLVLLDIPILRDQDNDSGFYAAAGGYYSGWPGGVLMKSVDGGQSYTQVASFVNGATIGYLTATPTTGDYTVIDTDNTINVKLYNSNTLSSVTEIAMLNGANAAAIGVDGRWVIIKFQTATLEGDGSYTLSNIIWGYKGTEYNLSSLASGDTFVLLSSASMIRTAANDDEIGSERHYKAVTFGKNIATASEVAFTNNAESLEPYAPTHIVGVRDGSSNLTVTWHRRTRLGGEWRDLVGASLSEDSEAYEIDFTVGGTTVTKTGITSETYSYTAAAQTTDFGSPQSSIITNIYQVSATTGRGHAGTETL